MTRAGIAAAVGALVAVAGSWIGWTDDGAPQQPVAAALDGSALFHAKGCAACHTGPGSTAGGGDFPPLVAASSWAGERRPGMSAAEYLEESIRAPAAFISPVWSSNGGPTTGMPDLGLSDAERDAIVAFLLGG